MSETQEDATYNAQMLSELGEGVNDDVQRQNYDSAAGTLDSLLEVASRLMKNLEDLEA